MSDESTTVDTTDTNDATAYGGKNANGTGFDPAYTQIAGQDLSKFTLGGNSTSVDQTVPAEPQLRLSPEVEGFLSKMFKPSGLDLSLIHI